MITGLAGLIVLGALAVILIATLSGARYIVPRVLGVLTGAGVTLWCAFVVFALLADNRGVPLTLPGLLAMACFSAIAIAAALAAARGVAIRRRQTS